jgi:microcystin-dependent protein
MAAAHMGTAGSGLAHENRMPVLPLNWCIAWSGIFPSR